MQTAKSHITKLNKRVIVTYHSNSSEGIGGIEELTRGLKQIAHENKIEFVEIFHSYGSGRYYQNQAKGTHIHL